MQTSEARIAERSLHPSERRAAGTDPPAADRSTQRTSGDGAWAAPAHETRLLAKRQNDWGRGGGSLALEPEHALAGG